jgi:hypothetical protein
LLSVLVRDILVLNGNGILFLQDLKCAFVVGEAQYINDLPALPMETYAAFVLTSVGQGYISDIDPSEALVSKCYSNWAICATSILR